MHIIYYAGLLIMSFPNYIKKQFIKDNSLPIPVCDEPYFSYFLDLYQDFLGSKTKFEEFSNFVNKVGENNFSSQFASVQNSALDYMRAQEGYDKLGSHSVVLPVVDVEQASLYKRNLAGQKFVSIDLKKSNFQCLSNFDSALVANKGSYEEFLAEFTDDPFVIGSKQIRQTIFGKVFPKKTMSIQKKIILDMVTSLLKNGIKPESFLSFSTDEIILHDTDDLDVSVLIEAVSNSEFDYHIDYFTLNLIHDDFSFFVKEKRDGSVSFKNVPMQNYAEAFKFYFNKDLDYSMDLVFSFEKRLSHFNKPLLFKE
jgi:hypothetical protein